MTQQKRKEFGTKPLGSLLRQQAIPAAAGILVMSIYGIVDTIFVGLWVGSLGIAAITVVFPITILFGSVGMAIGVGGASVISRAFGEDNEEKAFHTFVLQCGLTVFLGVLFLALGLVFQESILKLFGGRGDALEPSSVYFGIVLLGVPFLALAMMANNVIRAEGYPRTAMFTLIIPAVVNIALDPLLIIYFDMGLAGAAWATTISYVSSAGYAAWFFLSGRTQMVFRKKFLKVKLSLLNEILSLSSVTLARQGTISLLAIVLNNSLFMYGGEIALAAYGIVSRLMLFANFPVIGITQGFIPIVGYNYGAQIIERVRKIIRLSMGSATAIATVTFALIIIFTPQIVSVFTTDEELIRQTVSAMRKVFLATPLIAVNLIGSAYFQAIGMARPAFVLALSKQGFLLIPLVLLLPPVIGLNGIWFAFPLADFGAAVITGIYFKLKYRTTLEKAGSKTVEELPAKPA